MTQLSEQSLQALKALDTPTVCNAIEAVYPNRRNRGFTVRPFFCFGPDNYKQTLYFLRFEN